MSSRPENSISSLLEVSEQNAVKDYLVENTIILTSGIAQLLRVQDDEWSLFHTGLISLVKDYNRKCYELQLLIPSTSNDTQNESVKVLWRSKIDNEKFNPSRPHKHLVTFELNEEIYGLNFYESNEAAEFVKKIFEIQTKKEKRLSRIDTAPKRAAPPPPMATSTTNNPCVSMEKHTENFTAAGVQVHEVQLPTQKKEEKEGFLKKTFRKIGGNSEKKKKKKPLTTKDISKPTNFQHVEHVGIDSLDDEQKEMYDVLKAKLNIKSGNQKEEQLIIDAVTNRKSELQNSIMLKKQRDQQNGGGMKVTNEETHEYLHANAKRGTPRDIKNANAASKKGEVLSERASTPPPPNFGKQESDPLNPNWDSPSVSPPLATLSASPPTGRHSPTVTTFPVFKTNINIDDNSDSNSAAPPPLPSRGESRNPRLLRKDTPAYDAKPVVHDNYPKLPAHHHRSISPPHQSVSQPLSSNITPPHTPGTSPSPIPPAPPLPDLFAKPALSPNSTTSSSPPSPPAAHHQQPSSSTISLPSVSNERKSLLMDIQNVDRSQLLKPVNSNSNTHSSVVLSSPGEGGILHSLQIELDKIRSAVKDSDSEDDTETDDDEWD